MRKWISNRGVTAIFTRDMSWANNDTEVKKILFNKAQNNELIIVTPKVTKLSGNLKKKGAGVFVYKNLAINPQSRFTIIRYGRQDSAIAVGKTHKDGIHHIDEYYTGESHIINVANDLVQIIEKMNEKD